MSGDDVLVDPEELLYRQVHPNWVVDGRISSQTFKPTKKDEGRLSVARGATTSPRAAYELHVERKKLQSAGTWAVSVDECSNAGVACRADPLAAPPESVADPAHAFIDMRGLTTGRTERIAAVLADAARARGRMYPPIDAAT